MNSWCKPSQGYTKVKNTCWVQFQVRMTHEPHYLHPTPCLWSSWLLARLLTPDCSRGGCGKVTLDWKQMTSQSTLTHTSSIFLSFIHPRGSVIQSHMCLMCPRWPHSNMIFNMCLAKPLTIIRAFPFFDLSLCDLPFYLVCQPQTGFKRDVWLLFRCGS